MIVKFVQPHPILQETKECGQPVFQRIGGIAIQPPTERDTRSHERERNEKHRLNEQSKIQRRGFAAEILMEPRPGRRQNNAEAERTNGEHEQGPGHHRRTFARALGSGAARTEEDVNHLPRHVERGQDYARHHQVMRRVRRGPVRGGVENLLLRPGAGEKERHAAQRHHSNRVGQKCNRHEPTQSAHLADVLFVMATVNHRAGAEEKECLEEPVRDQVRNPSRHATHA